ncbi:unnamed protein product [Leptosia nina]|uniref:Nuclear nucleic acid-binding protein C1D n=1 Tax=Leptosia nina TaxID=320188 RepID=A0AAV1J0I7_9NEOP
MIGINWELKFGAAVSDHNFVGVCKELNEQLVTLHEKIHDLKRNYEHRDKMSLPAQIDMDLSLALALNSLYWIQLRIEGVDLSDHPIKHELIRLQKAMKRWRQIQDSKKRPTMDIAAAKRFIASGLNESSVLQPANKKKKLD